MNLVVQFLWLEFVFPIRKGQFAVKTDKHGNEYEYHTGHSRITSPSKKEVVFKSSVHTSNKTQCLYSTKINLLILFTKKRAVHSGNHKKTHKYKTIRCLRAATLWKAILWRIKPVHKWKVSKRKYLKSVEPSGLRHDWLSWTWVPLSSWATIWCSDQLVFWTFRLSLHFGIRPAAVWSKLSQFVLDSDPAQKYP